jgi:hypothetical protein
MAPVRVRPKLVLKDWVHHRPGGLDRVLTGEKRAVAGHGIAQEPFVRRFLSRPFIKQVELPLVADELLSCALDPSSEGYRGVRG